MVLEQAHRRLVLRRGQDARHRRPEPGGPGRAEVVQGRDLGEHADRAAVRRGVHRRPRGAADRPQPHRARRPPRGAAVRPRDRRRARPGRAAAVPARCARRAPPWSPSTTSPTASNVGQARRLGLPVVIGRGADPSLLRRLSIDQALALAAVTSDDLQNIKVVLSARAEASRPADGPARGLQRDGRARRARSSGSATSATCTASAPSTSPASRSARPPPTWSSTATPRTCATPDGGLERCPYPVAA